RRAQQALALRLGPLLFRDVTRDGRPSDHPPGFVRDRRGSHRDVDAVSVLSLAHGPEVLDPFSPPEPLQPTAQLLPLAGWCDPEDRAADHLLGGVAVHALGAAIRSEEHTSELQSREKLVCRLLLE